ncbi:MAG TPA: DUF72 domain-containing protein [Thermoanaerobaculia bacterium]|jgi:uncharacterized protein YecE (DUF72 family)|nr:DUF72 domain-containing protein [Thermoanaerobaculia bacterium]
MAPTLPLIGCAGWSLPGPERVHFPEAGSLLERYASRFPAAEINSSFHRPHRPATYARWSASVPADFRFSVKIPKTITHGLRLQGADILLETFLEESAGLGDRLGCLLVQLPPSLSFEPGVASAFFAALRSRSPVPVACEPRHASWFTAEADETLIKHEVARVAADPARVPAAGEPGGWPGFVYFRLHGSPRIYYSAYEEEYLDALASRLKEHAAAGRQAWCIFDNTVLGAATRNALDLLLKTGTARR